MIEFQKIKFNEFREVILHIFLENNNLIRNSSQILRMIFGNLININPEEIPNILDKIKNEKSSLLKIIINNKTLFLDEIIMNIYEGKIMLYFEYLHESKDSKNIKEYIFDNSKKLFEDFIQFLDNISISNGDNSGNFRDQNFHLCKLYIIVYIKIYLYKILILFKNESNENNEYKDIIEIIKNIKNEKFKKVIIIYIFLSF